MSRGRGDLAYKYLYNNDLSGVRDGLSGVRDGFNGTRLALKLGQDKSYCPSFNLELGQDKSYCPSFNLELGQFKSYCHSFTLKLGQLKLARPSLNRAGNGLRGHGRELSALGRRGAFLEAQAESAPKESRL